MKSVSAREANQRFSKLLAEAASGEEVVITKRGKPVAQLGPVKRVKSDQERERAIEKMVELMRTGIPMSDGKLSRDEMHER